MISFNVLNIFFWGIQLLGGIIMQSTGKSGGASKIVPGGTSGRDQKAGRKVSLGLRVKPKQSAEGVQSRKSTKALKEALKNAKKESDTGVQSTKDLQGKR